MINISNHCVKQVIFSDEHFELFFTLLVLFFSKHYIIIVPHRALMTKVEFSPLNCTV